MRDILVAVLIGAFTFVLAYMGVHVTLHPPKKVVSKRKWKIAFWAVAVIACASIGMQTKINGDDQAALNKHLQEVQTELDKIQKNTQSPPTVTVNVPPPSTPQILSNANQGSMAVTRLEFPSSLDTDPFRVNFYFSNVGQVPLPDIYEYLGISLQPMNGRQSDAVDRKAYFDALKTGKESVQRSREGGHSSMYLPVGLSQFTTWSTRMTPDNIEAIMKGSSRLYFFVYADWNGGKSNYVDCRWLQPPPKINYGSATTLVLHVCSW